LVLKCKPVYSASPEDQKRVNKALVIANCREVLSGQDRPPAKEGFVDDDVRKLFAADVDRGFKGKTTSGMQYEKVLNQGMFRIRQR